MQKNIRFYNVYLLFLLLFFCIACNNESQTADREEQNDEIIQIPTVSSDCLANNDIDFDRTIKVARNSMGYVRIRSNDSFTQGDLDNVIGTVKCGASLNAYLPEKFRAQVDGMVLSTRNPYYIVKVKNEEGVDCIGYIAGWILE